MTSNSFVSLDWPLQQLSRVCLRYFNVAGAVDSRLADRGENNVIPRVFRALTSGANPQIFGGEYPTPDGTCICDYIHVNDVAEAHAEVMLRMEVEDLGNVQHRNRSRDKRSGSDVGSQARHRHRLRVGRLLASTG
jgi:UDP-glucose 4-epimerase